MTRADRIRLFKRERCSNAEICEYLGVTVPQIVVALCIRRTAPTYVGNDGTLRYRIGRHRAPV